jgi:hypothetical protein
VVDDLGLFESVSSHSYGSDLAIGQLTVLSHAVDVVLLEMLAATRRFGVRCVLSRVTLALETLSRCRFKHRTGLSAATQAVRTSKPDRETLLPHISDHCHKFTYVHYCM